MALPLRSGSMKSAGGSTWFRISKEATLLGGVDRFACWVGRVFVMGFTGLLLVLGALGLRLSVNGSRFHGAQSPGLQEASQPKKGNLWRGLFGASKPLSCNLVTTCGKAGYKVCARSVLGPIGGPPSALFGGPTSYRRMAPGPNAKPLPSLRTCATPCSRRTYDPTTSGSFRWDASVQETGQVARA